MKVKMNWNHPVTSVWWLLPKCHTEWQPSCLGNRKGDGYHNQEHVFVRIQQYSQRRQDLLSTASRHLPWTNRTAGHDNQHILRCWHQLCPELHEYSAFFPQVMTSPSNSRQELNLVNFVSGPRMESVGGERPLQCLTHPESSNSRQKGNYPFWTFISSWIAGCGWLACLSYIQFRASQAR